MAYTIERYIGTAEPHCAQGSGLRLRYSRLMLVSDDDRIATTQAIGGAGGTEVPRFPGTEYWDGTKYATDAGVRLTLVGDPRLNPPSTLVFQIVQVAPDVGTVRFRIRGFDQFGALIEEITPTVAIVAKTNNFIYGARVFAFVTEVAFVSTLLDNANCTVVVGTRWDWTRTIDAANEHHAGLNLGVGVPEWIRRTPTGSTRSDAFRLNKDPSGPAEVKATATLTVTETAAVAATATLTAAGAFSNAETITLGGILYTLKTGALTAPTDIKIQGGAPAIAADIAQIQKALNATGTAGVDYGLGLVAHPTVNCSSITPTTLVVTADTAGTGGNSITKAEACVNASWDAGGGGTTLSGGVAYVGISNNETAVIGGKTYTWKTVLAAGDGFVLIGATVADSLKNLQDAINLGAGAGTTYGANTVVHPSVRATAVTATTITITAKEAGSLGNTITLSETMAVGVWSPSTTLMSNGVSDHREIMGMTVREVVNSSANMVTTVITPQDYELGAAVAGWASSPEKLTLLRQAAVAGWAVADPYMVDLMVRSED